MSQTLRHAAELAAEAARPYPNDSPAYREARVALLAEEIELRRHIERVAEMRRALPPGGAPNPDHRFLDEEGRERRLADLFGRHHTLVTYFWMFGPQRERPCPMCTAMLAGLDGPARDLSQRVAVAVLGRSPVSRQLAFARERGWRHLRFFQTVGDDFARDYRGLAPDGSEWPALDVWVRRDGQVRTSGRRRWAIRRTRDRSRAAHPTRCRCGTSSTSRPPAAGPTDTRSWSTPTRIDAPGGVYAPFGANTSRSASPCDTAATPGDWRTGA